MIEKVKGAPQPQNTEFVTFRIGDEDYCINIMTVREIRSWTTVTSIPKAPPYVCGLINLRGTVMPIIDLSARLGLPATEPSERHVNIVVQLNDVVVGLLVDAVSDIFSIKDDELHEAPPMGSEHQNMMVKEILSIGDRMIQLVDVEQIFPEENLVAA